jgi:hypothetical protein
MKTDKQYKLLVEFNGKRAHATTHAENENEAKENIRQCIKFLKVEEIKPPKQGPDLFDFLKGFKK